MAISRLDVPLSIDGLQEVTSANEYELRVLSDVIGRMEWIIYALLAFIVVLPAVLGLFTNADWFPVSSGTLVFCILAAYGLSVRSKRRRVRQRVRITPTHIDITVRARALYPITSVRRIRTMPYAVGDGPDRFGVQIECDEELVELYLTGAATADEAERVVERLRSKVDAMQTTGGPYRTT
jgi:hypothetical protein